MEIIDLELKGLKLIKPRAFEDRRGFFKETYNQKRYKELGIEVDFVQDNHSYSVKNTIRGMHFQNNPGQDKLISVIEGKIYDVAVDIRKDSPTFKKWIGVELDSISHHQFFIPKGFAHGFLVLSESAHVVYKISSIFDPKEEREFYYDDQEINILWPTKKAILSEKDKKAPRFKDIF